MEMDIDGANSQVQLSPVTPVHKGSPFMYTPPKNAPRIWVLSVHLEPLALCFCLLDSQAPKAIMGRILLLSALRLADVICMLGLFLSFP